MYNYRYNTNKDSPDYSLHGIQIVGQFLNQICRPKKLISSQQHTLINKNKTEADRY